MTILASRTTRHPNILALGGDDIVDKEGKLIKNNVKDFLFSNRSPLGDLTGKIDFVICFVVNSNEDSNHSYEDFTLHPKRDFRPLRGIIQITDDLLKTNVGRMAGTIAHEIGHHWLVPKKAQIRKGDKTSKIPTSEEIFLKLLAGRNIPKYPIMGRQHSHWSIYIAGENSIMDSVNHVPFPIPSLKSRYTQVEIKGNVGPSFWVRDVGNVKTFDQFSPLDHYIMGISTPFSTFQFIDPRWVFPLDFHSGLYFELENGETWYFGFYKGPHKIRAETTDGKKYSKVVELNTPYNHNEKVGLRVHQDTSKIHLQVRIWPSISRFGKHPKNAGLKHKPQVIDNDMIMGDLANNRSASLSTDPYKGWKNLMDLHGNIRRIGFSTRTLRKAKKAYVKTSAKLCIYDFEFGSFNAIRPLSFQNFSFDRPKKGPKIFDDSLIIPYYYKAKSVTYRETPHIHNAPKLTMSSPSENFVFGGAVRIDACLMPGWAGMSAKNKFLVGKRHDIKFKDFLWRDKHKTIKQQIPPKGYYKMLFCLTARDVRYIFEDDRLDSAETSRKILNVYFPLLTKYQRGVNSYIDFTNSYFHKAYT